MKRILNLATTVCALALLGGLSAQAQSKRPTDNTTDEAGLWYTVDKIEEHVKTSGVRVMDPDLIAYAEEVTCRVVGEGCKELRVYIIDEPQFNAGMYPNGMMLIYSGLLLRTENEAQLACVIGHEYGHFIKDHSLQRWRSAKRIANASILLNIVGAAAGAGRETSLGTAIAGALYQSSYSREHERESDIVGFEYVAKAGYDTRECANVWTNLIGELDESQYRRVRRAGRSGSPFSSHPVPTERAIYLGDLAGQTPGGDYIGEAEHKAATRPFMEQWLKTELLAKDFDRHIFLFEELKSRGRPAGMLDYYVGEAYRLRRDDGDRELAGQAWEAASKDASAPAQTWRSLGEYYRREKRNDDALAAYKVYLEKDPNAPDRALIERYIKRLEG